VVGGEPFDARELTLLEFNQAGPPPQTTVVQRSRYMCRRLVKQGPVSGQRQRYSASHDAARRQPQEAGSKYTYADVPRKGKNAHLARVVRSDDESILCDFQERAEEFPRMTVQTTCNPHTYQTAP